MVLDKTVLPLVHPEGASLPFPREQRESKLQSLMAVFEEILPNLVPMYRFLCTVCLTDVTAAEKHLLTLTSGSDWDPPCTCLWLLYTDGGLKFSSDE